MNEDRQIESALGRAYGPVDRQGVWKRIEERAASREVAASQARDRRLQAPSQWTRQRRTKLAAYALLALVAIAGITVGTTVGLDGGQVVFGMYDGRDGHWEKLPVVEQGAEVTELLVDPEDHETLYGATREGVIRSTDATGSWESVLAMGQGFYQLTTIAGSSTALLAIAHPFSSVASDGRLASRLMWSDDGGTTWTEITENLLSAVRHEYPGFEPGTVVIQPYDESEFPGAVILSVEPPRQGLTRYWKSTDRGMTWIKLDEAGSESVDASNASYRPLHMDLGLSWELLKDASGKVLGSLRCVAVDPEDPSLIYAGTTKGVCRSSDGGDTWVDVSRGIEHEVDGSLVIDPAVPWTMYVSAQEGIFKSEDEGATWKRVLSSGYTDELGNGICSFALAPSRTSTLYAWISEGLFRSEDGGETWSRRRGELSSKADLDQIDATLVAVASGDPDIVFASVFTGDGDHLIRSVDGGDSWTTVLERIGYGGLLADPNDPSTLYTGVLSKHIEGIGSKSSLAKSIDGGATWQTVLGLDEVVAYFAVALGVGDPTPIYVSHALTPFLVTLDAEGSFSTDGVGLAELEISILRSLDGGASWEEVEFVGLPGPMDQMICDRRSSGVWYGFSIPYSTEDGFAGRKVYRSSDGGHTWVTAFESMPPGCGGIAIGPGSNGSLYAYGSGGVYKWVPAEDGDAGDEPTDPSESISTSSASSGGWGCSG